MELFKAFKEWSDQNDGQIEDISNFFSVSLPPGYIDYT
jgi:hypothetical protein